MRKEGINTSQTQKGVWTNQEKKKYIEFIIQNLSSLNEKVPYHFYKRMASTISNSKTPKQCVDFHQYRKQLCENLEELVLKIEA